VRTKFINDPVYGFIRFPEQVLWDIISHPWFQRLRRIKQMGLADLIYPGATHTRFHHSLGACHLMQKALFELETKGIELHIDDKIAASAAILLHDIGHGPFSHSLEKVLVEEVSHEAISFGITEQLGHHLPLEKTKDIFNHFHQKQFLPQLVSSQLDVDRMDYLNRDSMYTGVSEGVIGYDRILQMLTVRDNKLMVEEKGIHSIEKFLIARRLMYWQVYLHKTVLGAEQLLINIIKRTKLLIQNGDTKINASPALMHFLNVKWTQTAFFSNHENLTTFCLLDDTDVLHAIKMWITHPDLILSTLCKMLIGRHLYKVQLSDENLDAFFNDKLEKFKKNSGMTDEEAEYFVFKGTTSNNTYNPGDEQIWIAMKDGTNKELSRINHVLVNESIAVPIHKNYICYTPFEDKTYPFN